MNNSYSLITWILILAPLTVFLIITVWVISILDISPQWKPTIPIVVGFATLFLLIGVFIRTKFGKFAL
ncbi:hypothetical protein [Saccharolobus caldissimus]|nr:hypothetical protein [Saccharolobus caldissimus]